MDWKPGMLLVQIDGMQAEESAYEAMTEPDFAIPVPCCKFSCLQSGIAKDSMDRTPSQNKETGFAGGTHQQD